MPYSRPTLTDLDNQVAQDIESALPGTQPLLRFANLRITGRAQARLANLHYGYLDWIAKQSNPFTAEDEFLEAWAALKNVYRKAAASASGAVTFTGTNGLVIPAGTSIVRDDGVTATVSADATVTGGSVVVSATVDADPTGATGAFGNADAGVTMRLGQAIAGIQSAGTISTAFTGGADMETADSLRSRMLEAYQNPPQGGDESDYVTWALEVLGVTRAWCVRNGFGAGTVVVYTMFDASEAVHNGFPQGTNGVAADETRATAATGDQLAVADYIYPLQPVTALVYSMAPTASPVDFTITGIVSGKRVAVEAAIADVLLRNGSAKGGTVPIAFIWSAIASVSGVTDFVITTPSGDITNTVGTLPTVGAITWA
jgi:uncharacterized phage protein gp47/JayE